MDAAHRQGAYAVRLEHGPVGAAAVVADADLAVVVDVLSFTTTLGIACARGVSVLPMRWRDERAAAYAEQRGAVLAVGRLEARASADAGQAAASLSPSVMARLPPGGPARVVLPSPNGSTICFGLRDGGATVVAASLRNRTAVVSWLAPRLAAGARLAVVASGERWPDGSLRPAVEDVWGAGAVLAGLADVGVGGLSPEAELAAAAYRAVRSGLARALHGCASGRELVAAGFAADVEVAAEQDVDDVVPVLTGDAFSCAPPG